MSTEIVDRGDSMSRIPLSVPYLGEGESEKVFEALQNGWVSTAGPYVTNFEAEISQYLGVSHSIAVSNGTAGLHLALREIGINKEHEVICPTITFISPINAVLYLGASPVFIDCDEYLNINVEKIVEFIERKCAWDGNTLKNKNSGKIVKAILPVHVFGNICNMEIIMDIAGYYKLRVVEDATEALGSKITSGKFSGFFAGTIGDIGVFSFNGNKIITTGGGGMVVARAEKHAAHIKYLSTQAKNDGLRYVHNEMGYNYRMTTLQAALGSVQLSRIDQFIKIKEKNFTEYRNAIKEIEGLSIIDKPDYVFSNRWFYAVHVDENKYGMSRDDLICKMNEENIETRPLWKLNHTQEYLKQYEAYEIRKAFVMEKEIINIPCSVGLTDIEREKVIDVLQKGRK